MNQLVLTCQSERRRNQIRYADQLYGLDYLEVSYEDPNRPLIPTLTVYFLGRAPTQGQAPGQLNQANLRIKGGQRIRDVKVTGLVVHQQEDKSLDDFMVVTVDGDGDFSTYTLSVVAVDDQGRPTGTRMAGFDPRYASLEFSFKACCPSHLDCKGQAVCPPPNRVEPEINYLAKDYASFRQLILDRLSLLMPDWQERHVPDIGITLVELLAYVGDYLSYYQDAVATEAYLDTARQRISVRRHARLVDYQMHEGCNARAWLTIHTDQDVPLPKVTLQEIFFSTETESGSAEIFEPVTSSPTDELQLYQAHNELKFYTWGDKLCCLPTGATSATLVDEWKTVEQSGPKDQPPTQQVAVVVVPKPNEQKRNLQLKVGDVLIFEEVKGPRTGNSADADPSRRWAVRLTRVTPMEDPLKTKGGQTIPVVEIEWAVEDALPFAFCLSTRLPAPDCRIICDTSVARGNVILVDHGQTIKPPEDSWQVGVESESGTCECEGSAVEMTSLPRVFRPSLKHSPLTFCETVKTGLPASQALVQDPRKTLPAVSLTGLPGVCSSPGDISAPKPKDGIIPDDAQWIWRPLLDLLKCSSLDQNFVVETDNDAVAHLRFGDGQLGRMPEACMIFEATYRIGNGTPGNVGADTITKINYRQPVSGLTLKPRNPFPAQGGTDPEPTDEVKLFAPGAFKRILERAITAADYATIAERNPKLQQANGALRWTGSWYEAHVAVDPLGSETADDGHLQEIKGCLYRYRRIGHDLVVNPAQYVPLEIEMTICVLSQYLRGHVEAALLDVFSNRTLPNGQLGFFHPDKLTFGDGISLSRLVATAQAVTGVQSVTITKFQRLFGVPDGVTDMTALDSGVVVLGPSEIPQLDNDPSFPEHGKLKLDMRGGR